MIDRYIGERERTHNRAEYSRFVVHRSQNNDKIDDGEADDGDEPNASVSQAELLPHRFRLPCDQRNGIAKTVRQIDDPCRKKQRGSVPNGHR